MPVWLDGRLLRVRDARVAPNDRGFTLGDGLFETIRVDAARARYLDAHLARLREGARLFDIALNRSDADLDDIVRSVIDASGFSRAAVRITLTRGPAPRRGLAVEADAGEPTLLVSIASLDAPTPPNAGERRMRRAILATVTRRNERSPLARVKSLNYGDAILARREATAHGADEAILLNTRERVACASAATVFARIEGRWRTPPLDDGALPGTARARVLARCALDVVGIERRALERCDALVTTTSLGAVAFAGFAGRALDDGPSALEPFYEL